MGAHVVAWLTTPLAGFIVAIVLAVLGMASARAPSVAAFDLTLLDAQFAALAAHWPIAADDGIVVIGIDEASLERLREPVALTHRPLGAMLAALADARPRAVALDVILPDRSYESFAPGSDQALIAGMLALRRVTPLIVGLTTRGDGELRRVHPPLIAAATAAGAALFVEDADGHIRRYDDRLAVDGGRVPTLVGEVAHALGATAPPGGLQYALGAGFDDIPLWQVLAWHEAGDNEALARTFRGKTVFVGYVLPHEDLKRQPVALVRGDAGADRDVPGVFVHAQALRTALAGDTVRLLPPPAQLPFALLAASLWFVARWRRRVAALLIVCALAAMMSVIALRSGVEWPLGLLVRVAITATLARSMLDAWQLRRERARLTALFGGYVSPQVLSAILSGGLARDATRGRRDLAFLFADVRGFTELSALSPPEEVLAILNRYFAAMTPVLHAHGGTIDNFRGDGMMVIFGAPNDLANPANAAILAARAMFARLPELNREFARERIAPLAIGVSLAGGSAVVGNVGSSERYNYTAIGDAANVAARLQDLTKTSGFPLVAAASLVARASGDASLYWTALGHFDVRGRDGEDVCGWRPASLTSAA